MSNLQLRKLIPQDEKAFLTALAAWTQDPGFIFSPGYESGMNFLDYLQLLANHELGKDLPDAYVPATSIYAFVNNEIIGRVSIRHILNNFLLKVGGHIGYGVLPKHRRKGYATEMLKQSLVHAKNLGITRVLVTCDDNNIGSYKAIEANGGILENTLFIAEDQPQKRRYWIELVSIT
jgi:predicted acetyltransferase